ncbi:MAG: hypothetical protein MUQ65_03805, partial [Armatimonadetes bacterium]|nr:hypothetical protein [Armatimonadota bacterium]
MLTTYSWDVENHMTGVELPDATLNTITYDGDGKRRQYEDSAGLRKFIWDGQNILLQTDSGGTTNRDYTCNPQLYGELISQSNLFHHYDALGSTMQLTDETQGAVVSYLYRAFGEQTVLSGSSANRFTWVGKLGYYRQPDTSDYWVRARVYEPSIGRWRRRDPFCIALGLLYSKDVRADTHWATRWAAMWSSRDVPEALGDYLDLVLDLSEEQMGACSHLYRYAENDPTGSLDPPGTQSIRQILSHMGDPYALGGFKCWARCYTGFPDDPCKTARKATNFYAGRKAAQHFSRQAARKQGLIKRYGAWKRMGGGLGGRRLRGFRWNAVTRRWAGQ